MVEITELFARLIDRLDRIESKLSGPQQREFLKEWYTIAEAAEILDRAPFTVREWARLDRINAMKRPSGRGAASEWMISHKEIERIKNKGLLPSTL